MPEITDEDIARIYTRNPERLRKLSLSNITFLWFHKCKRDPRYEPIKESVGKELKRRYDDPFNQNS